MCGYFQSHGIFIEGGGPRKENCSKSGLSGYDNIADIRLSPESFELVSFERWWDIAAVPVSVFTIGDQPSGRAFQQWIDEYVYSMGADIDFEKVQLAKPDDLVLCLICLPPELNGIRSGTSFRRTSAEFCSTFQVDHASFVSGDLAQMIDALKNGLIGAIAQVPVSRMPLDLKERFVEAAEKAALRLADEPSRHPRKPSITQT